MNRTWKFEGADEARDIIEQHPQSRREFVTRAGKFAAASVTAGAILDGLAPAPLPAQAPSPKPPNLKIKRVAVIGAGHYHATAPPGYLKILQNLQVDIVGVHDPDEAIAKNRAGLVGSTPYTDYRLMIEKTKPEFVLNLSRHVDMPSPIRFLIESGVPFMAEKPWGVDAKTVNGLADLAEKKKAWATFPAPMRYSQWAITAKQMVSQGQLGTISHMIVRFNQPGIQRYIDAGNSWMLDKKTAGGGALVNLGIHGFDLCSWITGEHPAILSAATSHSQFKVSIEDYAFVLMRTPSGIIFMNESGYTYPAMRGSDSERIVSAQKALVRLTNIAGSGEAAEIVGPDKTDTVKAPADYVSGWPGAVQDALERVGRGDPPAATAQECARAVELTFESYSKAGE
jgi:predicted dehydrogenase